MLFVPTIKSTSFSHLIVGCFSIKNLAWYYARENTRSRAGDIAEYRVKAKLNIRNIAWYYAKKKARAKTGDNAGDNVGGRGIVGMGS